MHNTSLTVVGSGIKFLSQMTLEAQIYIKNSDLVLYLVNDPALKNWIKAQNPANQSLDEIYFNFENRIDSYNAISDHILGSLVPPRHVCVVLYGHPCVFSKPALEAVVKARSQGIKAKMLPGISAEDCLFADLLIDPGSNGCQSYEATDFLIRKRHFDNHGHLILWQPDVIGMINHANSTNVDGLRVLVEHLSCYYPLSHEIVIYEAAQYPGMQPIINTVTLQDLPEAKLSAISTLYIKPIGKADINTANLMKLGLYVNDA